MKKEELFDQINFKKGAIGFLAILIVAVVLAPFALDAYAFETEFKEKYNISVTAINESKSGNMTIGIDTGDKLSFGTVPVQGTNKTKFINITSRTPIDLAVEMQSQGNITKYLKYDKITYLWGLNGTQRIPITVSPDKPGNFTGTFLVKVKKPLGGLGKKWMDLKAQYLH